MGPVMAQLEPLSGGAGWAGAGLLGIFLAWFALRYLPAKDRQIKEINDAHAKQVVEAVAEQRAQFQKSLELVLHTGERQVDGIVNVLHRDSQSMQASLQRLEVVLMKLIGRGR
jgi:hypothetical protein